MIIATIMNFEQLDQEEFRTIPYTSIFEKDATIGEILGWVKSINPNKDIKDVYFNMK